MFCMNCGSKLPDGAKFCMNCGMQIGKVDDSNKIVSLQTEVSERNAVKEEKYITFELLKGIKIQYVEDTKKVAKYFGLFVDMMNEMKLDLQQQYGNAGDIKKGLLNVENTFNKHADYAIAKACTILNENGIYDIGKIQYTKNYMSEYYEMFNENLNQVFDVYCSILEDRDAMADYREIQKASRGRWVGGGFGIKGAIKANIKASMMNTGSDLFHSVGDNIREASDNAEMNKKLNELYESSQAKNLLCDDPKYFILAVYNVLREILIERLQLSPKTYRYDMEKANALYEETLKSNYPNHKKKENYVKCMKMYPAEIVYYQTVIDAIVLQNKAPVYELFLNFWGINAGFLHDMINKCEKEYSDQKNSIFEYNLYEKRNSEEYSKWIDDIQKKMEQLGKLQYYFARFKEMGKDNKSYANSMNNVRLLEKTKVYLQNKNQYTDQIILYIDNDSFWRTGENGIVIATNEIMFLSDSKVFHLKYSDIRTISYKKYIHKVFFNMDDKHYIQFEASDYDNKIVVMAFIISKMKKRGEFGEKIKLNLIK